MKTQWENYENCETKREKIKLTSVSACLALTVHSFQRLKHKAVVNFSFLHFFWRNMSMFILQRNKIATVCGFGCIWLQLFSLYLVVLFACTNN